MSTTWLLRLRSCWAQRATMNKPAAASLRAVQYRSSTKSQLDRARPHICWPRPCQRPPRMATALTASADEAERAMARMLGEEAAASGSSLFAGDDNIRVAARIRPMSAKEVAADPRQAIKQFGPRSVQCLTEGSEHRFTFDRVFSPFDTQEAVYEQIGAPIVDAVMEGINGAIFAYGQTGSGKTFSMEGGEDDERGIIPRLLESLFARFRNPQIEFDVRCSCVEIYNETVFDLITYGKNNVEIWEDKDRGLTLMGATEVPIVSCAAALALFREAVKNRHTYETAMNATSSRSHCVFVLTVAKRVRSETATTFCQLYLADLAGSERVAKTQVSGDRLGEAKYINKSLLALGKVISALSDPGRDETAAGARAGRAAAGGAGSAAGHIPYRDSKLTRLLQNSLGGNSRTVLLIALSPSAWNASESLGTLRFGDMSSRIQNTAVARTLVSEERLADMIALARERRTRNDTMLQRCEAQAHQFYELFEALGVSRAEVAKLAGRGLGRAEAGMAAAEAARGEELDEQWTGSSSGAGAVTPIAASVAAAASSAAAAMAAEAPRTGRHARASARATAAGVSRRITPSGGGSMESARRASNPSVRPATVAASRGAGSPGRSPGSFAGSPRHARGSHPEASSALSPRHGAALPAGDGLAAAPSPAGSGRPRTAAAQCQPNLPGKAGRQRRSSARMSPARSRSRPGSKRRTDEFLARMADLQRQKEDSIVAGRERLLVDATKAAAVSGAGVDDADESPPRTLPPRNQAASAGPRLFGDSVERQKRQEQARIAAGRIVYDKHPRKPVPKAVPEERAGGPGLVALLSAD